MLEYLLDELLTVDNVSAELNRRRHITECYDKPYGDLPSKAELSNLINVDECVVCGMEGELICCDGCTASLHRRCIDIPFNKELPDRWLCVECRIADPGKMGPLRAGKKCELDWFTLQSLGHDRLPLSADALTNTTEITTKESRDVVLPDAVKEGGNKGDIKEESTKQPQEGIPQYLAPGVSKGEGENRDNGGAHIPGVYTEQGSKPLLDSGFVMKPTDDNSKAPVFGKLLSPEEKKRKDFFDRCRNVEFMVIHGFVFTRNCKTKEPCSPFRNSPRSEKDRPKIQDKKNIEPLTPDELLKLLKLLGPHVCAKWPWRQIPYDPSKVWQEDWDEIKAAEEKDVVPKRTSPSKDKGFETANKLDNPAKDLTIYQGPKPADGNILLSDGNLEPKTQEQPLKAPSLGLIEKREAFIDYFKNPESYSPISYINHYRWAPVPLIQKSHQGSYVSTSYRTLYTENLTWSTIDMRNNFRKESSGDIDLSYVLKVQSSLFFYNPMQPI
eukprot:10466372-Ditylum_brightwellii.AAC.1